MTYQELKARLSKCEYTLKCIKNGTLKDTNNKTVKKLELLKESLEQKLKEADSNEIDVFGYQTKHFHVCPGALSLFKRIIPKTPKKMQDMVVKLAKHHDILFAIEIIALKSQKAAEKYLDKAIEVASNIYVIGGKIGLDQNTDLSYIENHLKIINDAARGEVSEKELTDDEKAELKDIVKQLKGSVKGHGAQAKSIAKIVSEEDGVIFTDDESKAKELAKDGAKVKLTNEGPYQTTYIKVPKSDYKKAMGILVSNIDPTYAKMDVVDDDGDDNVIIYFNFRTRDGGEPGEDVEAFIYDAAMDLKAQGVNVTGSSHDLDETKDINDPVLMKLRALKTKIGRKKGIVKGGERLTGRKRELLAKLKAKRAQIMRDMENDPSIEPEGGPVADKYGDMLNKIDDAIEKARGTKPKSYDDTFNEGWNDQDDVFAFGYNLDLIQAVIDHLKSNYSEDDYELHIGRGDTHPNAVTLKNPEMENDEELGNLLIAAEDQEETDYQSGREAEKDYIGEKKRPGLWANIRAKRARGEKPAHKNSNAHKDAVKAGNKIKEQNIKLSKEDLSLIASQAGKAVVKAVNDSGDEVSRAKIKKVFSSALSPSTPEAFTVHVEYKNGSDVSYRFQIEGDQLVFLADSQDIVLSDVGVKPSGEPIINTELIKNEMIKYFNQMKEMTDKEYSNAQEADRLDNHPEKAKIIAIQNLIAKEKELGETSNPQDGKAAPYGSGYKSVAKEDKDVGHQDDEPDMLGASAMETAEYAAKLVKKLKRYDQHDGEVDFPNWWQKKLILARDYMSAAFHYLDSEEKQPAIDQLALEGSMNEKYTKEKLLAYLGQADDAMIRTYDDKYLIIYNPKNGNDDNATMWNDDSVFGVDQDGEEHEVRYDQIDGLQLEGINEESELDKITKAKRLIKQQASAMNKLPQDDPKRIAFINQVKQINTKHKELLAKQDDKISGTGRDQELSEGRGDFDDVLKAIENMSNNDDISERDAAAEIVLALADKFQLPVDKNLEDYMQEVVKDTNEYGSSQGARELETLFGALGYDEFDDFIEDNPGAVEALHGWISSIPEFRKRLGAEFSNSELEDMGMYDIAGYDDEDDDMDEAEAKPVPPTIMRGYNVNVKSAQTMAQALLSMFNQINSKEQTDFSKNSSIKRVLNLLNTISKTKDTESEQPEV